ncbi:MAG: hypothetical protein WAU69_12360 [Solirubrobacteraceae bacterium]
MDQANNRVDEFEADGAFVRAWGWGVLNGEEKLEVCTASCVAGEVSAGAGGFDRPDGIAIDPVSKDVYVVDQRNHRVEEFTASGEFVLMLGGDVNKTTGGNVCSATNLTEGDECQGGRGGSGSGEFESLGEQGAVTVGPTGLVYVGDFKRVQWFSSTGVVEGSFSVVTENQVEAIVVSAGGKICLTVNERPLSTQESPAPEVRCYSAAGVEEEKIVLEEQVLNQGAFIWLATDGSGHLFVDHYLSEDADAADAITQSVIEYDEEGKELRLFGPLGGRGGRAEKEPGGLGLTESGGVATGLVQAFIAEDKVRSGALPPPGPVILEEAAEPSTAGCLKLAAVIDPEDAQTKYKFAYGTGTPPGSMIAETTMADEGFGSEKVSVTQCGLTPETVYHYDVIAENANDAGKPAEGVEQSAVTGPALKIDGLWSANVSEAGATLEAQINPAGVDSEYRFEYAPVGGTYVATASVDIGAGTSDVRVAAPIGGLAAHAVYAYRVVAHNGVGTAEQEGRLVTQRAGGAPGLLDSRVWEQVSPPQKHSATIRLKGASGVVLAAPAGEKITYYAATTSESSPESEPVPVQQQIISTHDAAGWRSRDIDTPNSQRPELKSSQAAEYWLFSADLERSVVEPNPFTPLSQWTVEQERTPYVRDESKCPASTVTLSQLQASECYKPLLSDSGPFADVSKTVEYGGSRSGQTGLVNAIAATPDLSHVVLKSIGAQLEESASSEALYEWYAGKLAAVSVTRAGTVCNGTLGVPGGFGNLGLNSRNALSPDGSLAVWGGDRTSGECAGHVYVRDVSKDVSAQADEVQGVSGAGAPEAVYQDASVGDQHVFFTDSQRLTAGSTGTQSGVKGAVATEADLYEYAFDAASDAGSLVDMSVPVHAGEAAGVQGVLGVSEDGLLVYAVAHGVLSEEANEQGAIAKAGEDNLYLFEHAGGGWRVRFIATLAGEDAKDWTIKVGDASARVSPDGRWLAFMSDGSLTGYDNRDRSSGMPDQEAFLYSQSSGRLVCASCSPTGARPSGMEITNTGSGVVPLFDSEFQWEEGQWFSGVLPVRYAIGPSGMVGVYQPRYLSDGGRLFFESTEALVPQDTNGTVDVYEYEPVANGEVAASDSCSESSSSFSAVADGCIGLVSGGSSSEESVFVEASENGNDAFFETAAKLAGSDIDTAYDVYDAHSCGVGASWACLPPAAVSAASCESASACKTGVSLGGGAGMLASEALEGLGNLAAVSEDAKPQKSVGCPRGMRRHGGRCVRVNSKRRRHRAGASRRARSGKARRSRARGGR